MKKGIKGIIAGLIITMSLGMTAATGCSAKQAPAATATEQVTVTCDWDKVNSALDKYDFGKSPSTLMITRRPASAGTRWMPHALQSFLMQT